MGKASVVAPAGSAIGALLVLLPTLSAKDRAQLKVALTFLDDKQQSAEAEPGGELEVFWGQIMAESEKRGMKLPWHGHVAKISAYPDFKREALNAIEWITKATGAKTKTERVHSMKLAARALVARLEMLRRQVNVAITPMVVLRQGVNIIPAVQAQWPGGNVELQFALFAIRGNGSDAWALGHE